MDELYKLGVFHVVLQGGEPLAYPERLEALAKMCRTDETYMNVLTNRAGETRAADEYFADKPGVKLKTLSWTNSPSAYVI